MMPYIDGLSLGSTVAAAAVTASVWLVVLAAYRLFLGPLARFPGPKLAALTGWYETYYDCWRRGSYWVEVEQMHQKYGPIVRISPWELHVDDPDWNEAYKVSSRLNKYYWYYRFVGSSDAAFGTADHDVHRIRRKAQQTYFTLDSVARFDNELDRITSKLVSRLQEFKGTDQPANLSNAFRCLATDVVTEFAFDKSYNLLDSPDFAAAFQRTLRDFPEIGLWHRHFGLILNILDLMPRWLTKIINPAGIDVVDFMTDIGARTDRLVNDYKKNTDPDERSNIIHQMLDSTTLPAADKLNWRLALEMRTLVGAGTETTGATLTAITYHILTRPEKVNRLVAEITEAQMKRQTPLKYQELQQLPYLNAVVLEGLRIATPVAGRLPRINTREAMVYKSFSIPKSTPVSTTQRLTHFNPSIYASPDIFLPERWLVSPAERKNLEKYLQPFGRGSRSCLGIHLAYSEIYVTVAKLFGNFKLQLFDTDFDDIKQVHDFFSPFPESDKGLRVTVL